MLIYNDIRYFSCDSFFEIRIISKISKKKICNLFNAFIQLQKINLFFKINFLK